MADTDKQIGIEYRKPAFGKRFLAGLVDVLCTAIATIGLFFAFFAGSSRFPAYVDAEQQISQIREASGIYVAQGEKQVLISGFYSEDTSLTTNEKKALYASALAVFYDPEADLFFFNLADGRANGEGTVIYNEARAQARAANGVSMFVRQSDDDHSLAALAEDPAVLATSLSEYVAFYVDQLEKAQGYFVNNATYASSSTYQIVTVILTILVAYVVSILLFFLLVPLLIPRGYRTLGMLLGKSGLVYVNGLVPTRKRFLLRFLFLFLIEGLLSLFTFFLPVIFSAVMAGYGKYGASLPDLLANTYEVDLTKDELFFTPAEYMEHLRHLAAKGQPPVEQSGNPEARESRRSDRHRLGK